MNLIDQLDLLSRPNDYGDNAPQAFYFRPIPPPPSGGGRSGMRYECQPLRVAVQFAPAADITLRALEEIDRSLKYMGPGFRR